jgi:hypothetical protein
MVLGARVGNCFVGRERRSDTNRLDYNHSKFLNSEEETVQCRFFFCALLRRTDNHGCEDSAQRVRRRRRQSDNAVQADQAILPIKTSTEPA